eukprot:gnl/TRDRNA2_/TRDRNA2_174953_c0_seq1.p1 gnl/TRDRNA2_/TRDRNA2_174953_c0~~gnl/TRDRNA2_/TRDRNA2_174953_c0_seq1.p1  ORF type:complete len:295 (+),score=42.78 gnl/TRDRNA2_/TRDRNA2_174953_c0_seq1:67-951(+)
MDHIKDDVPEDRALEAIQEEGDVQVFFCKQYGSHQAINFEPLSKAGRYINNLGKSVSQQPIQRKVVLLLSFWLAIAFLEFCLTSIGAMPTSNSGLTQARFKAFTNTYWTSSLVLCPSNIEYRIANELVSTFFALGFTPNGIVLLNCCIRACLLRLYYSYHYNAVVLLLAVIQVLDAADGQLARIHGMTSKFGAALDHATDNLFSAMFMLLTMYLLACHNGIRSKAVFVIGSVFVLMVILGYHYEKAIEGELEYKDCNMLAVMGMHQALHMLYIQWVLTIVACHLTDWMPHQNQD